MELRLFETTILLRDDRDHLLVRTLWRRGVASGSLARLIEPSRGSRIWFARRQLGGGLSPGRGGRCEGEHRWTLCRPGVFEAVVPASSYNARGVVFELRQGDVVEVLAEFPWPSRPEDYRDVVRVARRYWSLPEKAQRQVFE